MSKVKDEWTLDIFEIPTVELVIPGESHYAREISETVALMLAESGIKDRFLLLPSSTLSDFMNTQFKIVIPAGIAGIVRPQGQLINRVKVPVGVCHNAVAESNCVIVKWGGEQLEAKRQPVG